MIWFLGILVYLLSIVGVRWAYRLCSSKYYNIWSDKECVAEPSWFVPIINTIASILVFSIIFSKVKIKNSKSKWLNGDL